MNPPYESVRKVSDCMPPPRDEPGCRGFIRGRCVRRTAAAWHRRRTAQAPPETSTAADSTTTAPRPLYSPRGATS